MSVIFSMKKGAVNGMKRPGLTFIELLITIMILSMIVVVVSSLLISSYQFNRDEHLRIDVGESASRVLGPLDVILREGKDVLASAVIDGTTYTTDTDTVVFTMPSIDGGGSTIPTMTDTVVATLETISANNNIIRLIVSPTVGTFRSVQNTIAVNHVKDLYIRYNADTPVNAQTLTITVQLTKNIGTRVFTNTNILYAVLRNHP